MTRLCSLLLIGGLAIGVSACRKTTGDSTALAASAPAAQTPAATPTPAAKPMPAPPQEQKAAGGPPSAEQSLNQGKTFYNERRYQEALAEFERVKKIDPANKDVYYLMGLTYFKMNQPGQALEAYRQCTSGVYASVSQSAVKNLEKKVGKVNAK